MARLLARLSIAVAGLVLASCSAPNERPPKIAAGDGWTRETAPGQSAAALYLTIANTGDGDDRLAAVDAPGTGAASLHASSSSGGVARMRPLEHGLAIPAQSRVTLEPGGTHIMLSGLREPLKAGQTIALNLKFTRSGRLPVPIRVVSATDGDGAGHGMRM